MAHDHDDHDDRDDRDDRDDHDASPAMDHEAVLEAIQGAIARGQKVQLVRAGLPQEGWSGFPLVLGDSLVLLRSLRDFAFDGFSLVRLADVTEVRSGDVERFYERVIRAEGLDRDLAPPRPVLLRSMRTALESIRAHYRHVIVTCEGVDDESFFLGDIARVDEESVHLHYIHVDGTRERDATRVPLEDITLVRFDEAYLRYYGRYAVAEDQH
jgi:hypothetical protein